MKRNILSLTLLAMTFVSVNAQEADRFVGAQHVRFQTACHPQDVKGYDTKTLRERFVMEKVMAADSILLTYSHYDRFIFGGAMPVNKTLKLENFWELGLDVDKNIKEKYFLYNREIGIVNCGEGDGIVIVDGKEYALSPKEALYVGRGHIGKDKDVNKEVLFRSKDASKPAKFYLNSATAHQHYKTQWITLDGRKGSLKAAVWGPVGSLEECNNRTVYKLIVNDVLEEGPCQLQLGLTQLNPGAAWNTMPPHTHGRRIEAYYYFNLPQEQTIAHIMGQPEESRVVWLHNDQAIMSPETSGSTGKPKPVLQRMKEFEEDNAFIISKWAEEFASRKLVTTVSQHHIYGFLFGSSLPFTLGVPFRRTRITYPEEFETLDDEKYIIIATPAFLKRTVEIEEKLPLKDTWIFTSGGACSPELAEKTEKLFGFCPLEVYGSTETSGIAYRQQNKDGLKFTPFDNAKLWLGEDGCLRIISPYIKDPAGFATADLAEFFEDGRFLLKGRSDSIVKIEEKRISLPEVEERLLQSGLVSDVKVVALSNDVRQFLAAALVLNTEGKKKFEGTEKYLVNRHFHDYLMQFFENVVIPKKWRFLDQLPTDVQGKKHKDEIVKLFENDGE